MEDNKRTDANYVTFTTSAKNRADTTEIKEEEEFAPSFSKLSDELVLRILALLNKSDLAKICCTDKRLNRISLDPDLWTILELPHTNRISYQEASMLITRCPKLKELNLLKWLPVQKQEEESLAIQAMKETKLQKLKLTYCAATLFTRFGNNNSNSSLTSLVVKFVPNIDDFRAIRDNVRYLPNFTEFKLLPNRCCFPKYEYCEDIKVLDAFGNHCKKLEVFHYHARVTAQGVASLLSGELRHTLKDAKLLIGNPFSSIESIQALERCQQLEKLKCKVPSCVHLASCIVAAIARGLIGLKSLFLDNCTSISANNFFNAFSNRNLRSLQKLKLHYCLELDDNGMNALAENCSELKLLSLRSIGRVFDDHRRVTNVGLNSVLTKCRKLQELRIYYMHGLTHHAFNGLKPAEALINLVQYQTFAEDDLSEIKIHFPNMNISTFFF